MQKQREQPVELSNYDLAVQPKRSEKQWKKQWRNIGNQPKQTLHFQTVQYRWTQYRVISCLLRAGYVSEKLATHQLAIKKNPKGKKEGQAGFLIFLDEGLWESDENMNSLIRRLCKKKNLQNCSFIFRDPQHISKNRKAFFSGTEKPILSYLFQQFRKTTPVIYQFQSILIFQVCDPTIKSFKFYCYFHQRKK